MANMVHLITEIIYLQESNSTVMCLIGIYSTLGLIQRSNEFISGIMHKQNSN